MINPGTYRARCTGAADAQWGKSQNGNTKLVLLFRFLDEPLIGQQISWVGTLTENTVDRVLDSLEYCGMDPNSPLDELRGIDQNDVDLVIVHEASEQNGQIYARVKWINRPSSGRIQFKEPLSSAEAKANTREFDALWRSRTRGGARPAASQRQSTPKGAPRSEQKPPPGRFDDNDNAPDDIPF